MFKKIFNNIKLFFYNLFTYKQKLDNDVESNLADETIVFINKDSINLEDY